MKPEEFAERCEAACAGLAILFADTPDDVFERGLRHFAAGVRDGLNECQAERLTEERVAQIVDAMTVDSRLWRGKIKSLGLH
jgi:hypothetical protein